MKKNFVLLFMSIFVLVVSSLSAPAEINSELIALNETEGLFVGYPEAIMISRTLDECSWLIKDGIERSQALERSGGWIYEARKMQRVLEELQEWQRVIEGVSMAIIAGGQALREVNDEFALMEVANRDGLLSVRSDLLRVRQSRENIRDSLFRSKSKIEGLAGMLDRALRNRESLNQLRDGIPLSEFDLRSSEVDRIRLAEIYNMMDRYLEMARAHIASSQGIRMVVSASDDRMKTITEDLGAKLSEEQGRVNTWKTIAVVAGAAGVLGVGGAIFYYKNRASKRGVSSGFSSKSENRNSEEYRRRLTGKGGQKLLC